MSEFLRVPEMDEDTFNRMKWSYDSLRNLTYAQYKENNERLQQEAAELAAKRAATEAKIAERDAKVKDILHAGMEERLKRQSDVTSGIFGK